MLACCAISMLLGTGGLGSAAGAAGLAGVISCSLALRVSARVYPKGPRSRSAAPPCRYAARGGIIAASVEWAAASTNRCLSRHAVAQGLPRCVRRRLVCGAVLSAAAVRLSRGGDGRPGARALHHHGAAAVRDHA